MAIAEVFDWKKGGQNYQEGLTLFEKLGGSSVMLRILSKGENSYTTQLLFEQLEQLDLGSDTVVKSKTGSNQAPEKKTEVNAKIEDSREDLHPYLKNMQTTIAKPLYRKRDSARARLQHAKEDRHLAEELCAIVIDCNKSLVPFHEYLDYWNNKGQLHPKVLAMLNDTPFAKWQRLNSQKKTAEQYVSRNHKNVSKTETVAEKKRQIADLSSQIEQLETLLLNVSTYAQ